MAQGGTTSAYSGQQVRITHGDQEAVVVEVGGGLRTYTAGGVDVVDGYGPEEMAPGAKGQSLAPWPNRLHGGTYRWDGEELEVPNDEAAQENALHGFLRWRSWSLEPTGEHGVVASVRLFPMEPYPFTLHVATDYTLGPDGLTVTTTATNEGSAALPWGHGAHPYLTVGTPTVDTALLRVPAASYLPTDENQIPTGVVAVEGTEFDFRAPRPIGALPLDYAFTDLDRDDSGRAWLELSAPGGRAVRFWVGSGYHYLELFSSDALPGPLRRRALGVEPMTCPPNAFVTGERVIRLEPGASSVLQWGITPGR